MSIEVQEQRKSKVRSMQVRPSRAQAEEAVRTLIRWAGDSPEREGLQDTPKRVVEAYQELFKGYGQQAEEILGKTFADVDGYGEVVLLKNIEVHSFCEHHILPIMGVAHVAYVANKRLVGLSKLARLVDMYAKRLQTQEGLTAQIILALEAVLEPQGAAVIVEAKHSCMTMRGVNKSESVTVTEKVSGCFEAPLMRARLDRMLSR